ncbi:MAG: glycine cleavage system aminomethyltransferase GcvT [Bacteroidetes bacterium]|nr:MAG: glycine cleavage system aminomethyltransferase GcvT [Bacteroidota bacterium]
MAKQTTLYPIHAQLGAKLIPFAGYDMPVRYQSDKQEHLAVRERVGVFDVSHMGEFIIRGPKALDLIQQVTSNDASKLPAGKAQYSCLPNHEGGIVDDVIVYHIRDDQYMIVANAANIQKDWDWISASNQRIGAEMIDISEKTSLIAVSGPKADATLQKLAPEGLDLAAFGTYQCWKGTFNGAEKSLIATTGYTGERTFEVFVWNEYAEQMWHDIMAAGEEFGIEPCGLGARDTLRLEMGYMLYGNDINDTTSPLEAGLGWITKLKKGPFNGSEAIAKLKTEGLQRKLVAFKLKTRGIPRSGYEIAKDGQVIGTVTSGSLSPVLNEGVGMGYVPVEHSAVGTELEIRIRNKPVPAEVVRPPFIPR